MGRPPLPIGAHGRIRFYPHPHPDGKQWRATTKYRGHDGVTRRLSRTGKSKAAAERALKTALLEQHSPGGDLGPDIRFKVAAELWLQEVQRLRGGTTFDTYRRNLNHRVLPAFGELRLRECTVPAVHRYLRALEHDLEANTVRTCRSVLSGVLAFAVQQGAIPANPVRDAGRIEGGGSAARALTREEREDFLRRLDADERAVADDLPDLVRFMIGTGVRIGEALALRWGQVDLDTREALVGPTLGRVTGKGLSVNERGKTGSALRMVPLPDFVLLMLQLRRPGDASPRTPVFPNTLGGWRDPNNTQRSIRKARAAAGYTWVTSHTLRKTAITILDEQRLTAREIAGHVGHSRPSITMDAYMDLRARGRSAADALDAAMRQE
jgi:integrase